MRRVFVLRFSPCLIVVLMKAPDSTVLVTDVDRIRPLGLFLAVCLKGLRYKKIEGLYGFLDVDVYLVDFLAATTFIG